MDEKEIIMTLPMQTSSTCYICQNISTHMILASTNRFGAPDLDLRPPEMERSTMSWWIQECPYCGYVASDISCATTVTEEWLKSEAYRSCENVTFKFALAEKFYKQYLIAIQEGKHRTAFYADLHAAWVCDDAHDIDNIFGREISTIYLTFSEPWPKAHDEKKRFTHEGYLRLYNDVKRECDNLGIVYEMDPEKIMEKTKLELEHQQEIAKEAYIQVKSLENLKEKQKQQYNQELLQEEFKMVDDIVNSRRTIA